MGVFDKIKEALFGRHAQAAEPATPSTSGVNASTGPAPVPASVPAARPGAAQTAPSGTSPEPQANASQVSPAPGAPSGAQPKAAAPSPAAPVDIEAIMEKAVKAHGQKLDWRHSIVDMMKALDLDSGLSERKELATELGYTGDTNDSAAMNVWLHKALMRKLAENGGKVPAELTD